MLRTTRVRVAIVGAGLMGRWHAYYARQCGATVAGIVDRNADAARLVSVRSAAAPTFATLDACLREVTVDAVHVCTDVGSHAELVSEALRAGKHVLVEKPVTDGYAGTLQLTKLAQRAGTVFTCVHQFPFQRGFAQARQALERIGSPVAVTFTAFSAGADRRDDSGRRKVLLEILPHPVSLLQSIFGAEMETSRWHVARFTSDELYLGGLVGKTAADIRISVRGRPTRNELAIVCSGGTAQVNLYHGFAVIERGTVSRAGKVLQPFRFGVAQCWRGGANLLRRAVTREPAYPGLRCLIERFYGALNGSCEPPVSHSLMLQAAWFVDRVRAFGDSTKLPPSETFDLRLPDAV